VSDAFTGKPALGGCPRLRGSNANEFKLVVVVLGAIVGLRGDIMGDPRVKILCCREEEGGGGIENPLLLDFGEGVVAGAAVVEDGGVAGGCTAVVVSVG
jgi:hypothetical protein